VTRGSGSGRDPRFKGHAVRFMQAVEAVVVNIDNYSEAVARRWPLNCGS